MKRLPVYAFVGLGIMAVSEILMLARVEPFWSWHTPIAWTGYILFVDGVVLARRGSSWLTRSRHEFLFLAVASIPLWLVFEAYNLLIRNWHYINLPTNRFWQFFGYGWSFATIWPAIFETAELVATFPPNRDEFALRPFGFAEGGAELVEGRQAQSERDRSVRDEVCDAVRAEPFDTVRPELVEETNGAQDRPVEARTRLRTGPIDDPTRHRLSRLAWCSIVVGAAMLIWPVIRPSPYLAASVWLGFIFLLDPFNARVGAEAISTDLIDMGWKRIVNLSIAGLVCGIVWEFWNYWTRTKWIYTVPIFPNLKIFEMPLPGYLGFPAFAIECFTMYVTVRYWLWRGARRPIGL